MPSPVEQRVIASLVAVVAVALTVGVVALCDKWSTLIEWLARGLGFVEEDWEIGPRRAPRWLHAFLLYLGLTVTCDGTRCERCGRLSG